MPAPPPFPTIPVPSNEVNALLETVLALKQAVELLTGQGADQTKFAAHVFVQTEPPEAYHVGDLWLCTGPTYNFSIWDGTRWLKATPPLPVTADEHEAFRLDQFIRRGRR